MIKDNIKNLSFDNDLLFPIEHLRKIIEKAKAEKNYLLKGFLEIERNLLKQFSNIGEKKEVTLLDLIC